MYRGIGVNEAVLLPQHARNTVRSSRVRVWVWIACQDERFSFRSAHRGHGSHQRYLLGPDGRKAARGCAVFGTPAIRLPVLDGKGRPGSLSEPKPRPRKYPPRIQEVGPNRSRESIFSPPWIATGVHISSLLCSVVTASLRCSVALRRRHGCLPANNTTPAGYLSWMVTSIASVRRNPPDDSNEPPWRQNFAPFR